MKSSLLFFFKTLTCDLREAHWTNIETELLSRVTGIKSSDILDWHPSGGFGVDLHDSLVPVGTTVTAVADKFEVWVSRVEFGFTGASKFEVGLAVLAVVADSLSCSGSQKSKEGHLASVIGSWYSSFFGWLVADWHAGSHVAPPLVGTGVDGGVLFLGDLGLSWVDASFDSVTVAGKVAVNFDGISFATLVWIDPVETVINGGSDFLGSEVKIETSPGWRFSVSAGWSSNGFDFTG
jgi:hypothetical protein